MSATDESENLPEHLTERIDPNGWRVISVDKKDYVR
jgi:hypothetical protein